MRFLLIFLLTPFALLSQNRLSGSFDTLTIRAGEIYEINNTVTISGFLYAEPGARIVFSDNGKLVLEGSLKCIGKPSAPIMFLGRGVADVNSGIVIRSVKETDIDLKFVVFDSLSMPMNFESGWYRKNVCIENCQFKNSIGSVAVIQLLNPASRTDLPSMRFLLLNNLFYKNLGSIYFEDFQSDFLKITVSKNAFINNIIAGFGQSTFSGNFIYGRNDYRSGKYVADIRDNSFVSNFLKDIDADTIIKVAHFGIYGSATALNVPNNFWGTPNESEVHAFLYDYVTNFNNPRLSLTGLQKKPSDSTYGHVYQILTSNKQLVDDNIAAGSIRSFSLFANRRFDLKPVKITFHYIKDSTTQLDTAISYKKRIEPTGIMDITLSDTSFINNKIGYFVISDLKDDQGFDMPDVIIGKRVFLVSIFKQKSKKTYVELNVNEKSKINAYGFSQRSRISFSLIGGTSLFYGTISNQAIFSNEKNPLFGLSFEYRVNRTINFEAYYLSSTLSGSDANSSDVYKLARGMAFFTPITILGVKPMFVLGQESNIYKKTGLEASLGFGINYLSFTPKGDYLGSFYELQPLGTGGQLLPNSNVGVYNTKTVATSLSLQLKHNINSNLSFSFFFDYFMSFSDYLDDVGPDLYPDRQIMESISPIAAFFSNPTNKSVSSTELRSGIRNSKDAFFTLGFKLSRGINLKGDKVKR